MCDGKIEWALLDKWGEQGGHIYLCRRCAEDLSTTEVADNLVPVVEPIIRLSE
jgi:hypothetical protein